MIDILMFAVGLVGFVSWLLAMPFFWMWGRRKLSILRAEEPGRWDVLGDPGIIWLAYTHATESTRADETLTRRRRRFIAALLGMPMAFVLNFFLAAIGGRLTL